MTTHEMVERMLVDIDDDGEIDPFDLEIDDSMSDSELRVLLSQLPESESETYTIH